MSRNADPERAGGARPRATKVGWRLWRSPLLALGWFLAMAGADAAGWVDNQAGLQNASGWAAGAVVFALGYVALELGWRRLRARPGRSR